MKEKTGKNGQKAEKLEDLVSHILEEARMVLPGIQALLGFQLIAVFNQSFKNIPKAIMQSVILCGAFYAFCAYIMVMGYSGMPEKLANCGTALIDLANINGVPILGTLVNCGAVISFFACTLSCITPAARIMFTMGHHGVLHPKLSQVHEDHKTPHNAVILVTVLGATPGLILTLMHCSLMDIITWAGTLAACSFILSYVFVSIAAPVHLHQLKVLKKRDIVISISAVCFMLLALIGNINPNAKGVEQFLPHIFIAFIISGAVWYLYLKVFAPQTIELMNADMENMRTRFLQDEVHSK